MLRTIGGCLKDTYTPILTIKQFAPRAAPRLPRAGTWQLEGLVLGKQHEVTWPPAHAAAIVMDTSMSDLVDVAGLRPAPLHPHGYAD